MLGQPVNAQWRDRSRRYYSRAARHNTRVRLLEPIDSDGDADDAAPDSGHRNFGCSRGRSTFCMIIFVVIICLLARQSSAWYSESTSEVEHSRAPAHSPRHSWPAAVPKHDDALAVARKPKRVDVTNAEQVASPPPPSTSPLTAAAHTPARVGNLTGLHSAGTTAGVTADGHQLGAGLGSGFRSRARVRCHVEPCGEDAKSAFANVYAHHKWQKNYAAGTPASGGGSTPLATSTTCAVLAHAVQLVRQRKAAARRSPDDDGAVRVLDTPCGDFTWMPHCLLHVANTARVDLSGGHAGAPPHELVYQGVDVAPQLVAQLNEGAGDLLNLSTIQSLRMLRERSARGAVPGG